MHKPKIIPICSPCPKHMPIGQALLIAAQIGVGLGIGGGLALAMTWAFIEGWRYV